MSSPTSTTSDAASSRQHSCGWPWPAGSAARASRAASIAAAISCACNAPPQPSVGRPSRPSLLRALLVAAQGPIDGPLLDWPADAGHDVGLAGERDPGLLVVLVL